MREMINIVINESTVTNEADVKADPAIVARFAKVAPSKRSYYINQWAKEEGIDSDEAMQLAGYKRAGYMGAGAYKWTYIGEDKINEDSIDQDKHDQLNNIYMTLEALKAEVSELYDLDGIEDSTGRGDLHDQIATMDKLIEQFHQVIDRANNVVPQEVKN